MRLFDFSRAFISIMLLAPLGSHGLSHKLLLTHQGNTENLINASIEPFVGDEIESLSITATFGTDYDRVYGSELRAHLTDLIEIIFQFDTMATIGTLAGKDVIKFITPDVSRIPLTRYLASFYNNARQFTARMSKLEVEFFKGLGTSVLCWALNSKEHFPNSKEKIVLRASGGESVEDMKKLVALYRGLSFAPVSESPAYLENGYESKDVIMYSAIADVQLACKKVSHLFFTKD